MKLQVYVLRILILHMLQGCDFSNVPQPREVILVYGVFYQRNQIALLHFGLLSTKYVVVKSTFSCVRLCNQSDEVTPLISLEVGA